METMFLTCFFIGGVFAVLTVLLGDFFDDFYIDEMPYLSPTVIAAFITVFGGIGYILIETTSLSVGVTIFIAVAVALIIAASLFVLVIAPLTKAEKSNAGFQRDMIGQTAEVTVPIVDGQKGEIIYLQGAGHLSASAVSKDGHSIRQGERVWIIDVAGGTFIVEKY